MTSLADIDPPKVTISTPPGQKLPDEGKNNIYENQLEVKLIDSLQTSDSEPIYLIDKIKEFKSGLEILPPSAKKSYTKAVLSLESFMRSFSLQYEPITTSLLCDWLIYLHISEHALSTLLLYLNSVSSLLSQSSSSAVASPLRTILKTLSAVEFPVSSSPAPRRVNSGMPSDLNKSEESISPALLRDIHTAAIIAGGITHESAARLRTDSLPAGLDVIAQKYAAPKRRFLFPLNQSAYTPRQLARRLAVAFATSPDTTLRSLPSPAEAWFREALKLGATPSQAITTLGRNPLPSSPIVTALLPIITSFPETGSHNVDTHSSQSDTECYPNLNILIAESLTANPLHWYALRLRQGITSAEFQQRLSTLTADRYTASIGGSNKITISNIETFQPTHRIAHRTPTGIHHTVEALLPGIIFIRLHSNDLLSLLHEIGDIAWCYRDPGLRNYAYAPIPDRQMQAFQLAVGIFTEETRIAPLGTIAPRPGQRILILGGPLVGQTATFVKTRENTALQSDKPQDTSRVLYRLTIPGLNGIEWEADLDPRILELLPDPN